MTKTIEQKAKAYDKALEIARSYHDDPNCFKHMEGTLEHIFPELAESEDEWMVNFIKKQLFNIKKTITENYELDAKLTKAIDWLEKQGEQKHIPWYDLKKAKEAGYTVIKTEEFEAIQKPVEIKPHLPDGSIPYDRGFEEAQEYLSKRGFDVPWNDCDVYVDEKHITQTVANVLTWADEHPAKPVEWSEEDELMYESIINTLKLTNGAAQMKIDWLKSLIQKLSNMERIGKNWKPTEE